MNQTEKKAFEMLSDEEKEQVSGGATITEETELTDRQCRLLSERLRKKKLSISLEPLLTQVSIPTIMIAYGFHVPRDPIVYPKDFPEHKPISKPIDIIKSPLENQEQTDIEK